MNPNVYLNAAKYHLMDEIRDNYDDQDIERFCCYAISVSEWWEKQIECVAESDYVHYYKSKASFSEDDGDSEYVKLYKEYMDENGDKFVYFYTCHFMDDSIEDCMERVIDAEKSAQFARSISLLLMYEILNSET